MADLFRYEQLRLSVERLMKHPTFPVACSSSFAAVINEVQDALTDLEQVPMRHLVRSSVTPPALLRGDLSVEEYDKSSDDLLHRRGPERRGPGYEPGLKRRKSDG